MKISTASTEAMQREAADWQSRAAANSDRDDFGLRCGWFPAGRSVVRFYPEIEDGRLKIFHRALLYSYKGVGQFVDPEDEFCSRIAAHAKSKDPGRSWAWTWQAQKVGIAHLCFFEAPADSNLKYVQEMEAQGTVLPNRVCAAIDRFIAGAKPHTLAKHLDPDSPGFAITIDYAKGAQGQASVNWIPDDEKELPQKLFERDGEWIEFPPLHETFIKDRHPDEAQRAQIRALLKAAIGAGGGDHAAPPAPVPARPAPRPAPAPAPAAAVKQDEFQDDDIPF